MVIEAEASTTPVVALRISTVPVHVVVPADPRLTVHERVVPRLSQDPVALPEVGVPDVLVHLISYAEVAVLGAHSGA